MLSKHSARNAAYCNSMRSPRCLALNDVFFFFRPRPQLLGSQLCERGPPKPFVRASLLVVRGHSPQGVQHSGCLRRLHHTHINDHRRQRAPLDALEAVANRVIWKNFLEAGAVGIVQADCTRLAGISEYLAVTLLATKYPVRVVPYVGDMGQIHQHLVMFNHIALGHEKLFLEHIPHLREYFVNPAQIEDGRYQAPQQPGASTDLHLAGMKPMAVASRA
jgi:hypothetical protein